MGGAKLSSYWLVQRGGVSLEKRVVPLWPGTSVWLCTVYFFTALRFWVYSRILYSISSDPRRTEHFEAIYVLSWGLLFAFPLALWFDAERCKCSRGLCASNTVTFRAETNSSRWLPGFHMGMFSGRAFLRGELSDCFHTWVCSCWQGKLLLCCVVKIPDHLKALKFHVCSSPRLNRCVWIFFVSCFKQITISWGNVLNGMKHLYISFAGVPSDTISCLIDYTSTARMSFMYIKCDSSWFVFYNTLISLTFQ